MPLPDKRLTGTTRGPNGTDEGRTLKDLSTPTSTRSEIMRSRVGLLAVAVTVLVGGASVFRATADSPDSPDTSPVNWILMDGRVNPASAISQVTNDTFAYVTVRVANSGSYKIF